MITTELIRPIEWKHLCDWAYNNYINYKKQYPNLTEKEIAESMFLYEYQKPEISSSLKVLANAYKTEVVTIPDLIHTILSIEVMVGKNNIDLAGQYADALFYVVSKYLKSLEYDNHLVKIAMIFRTVINEIEKKITDEKLRSRETLVIIRILMTYKIYKQYKTSEQLIEAIQKILAKT